MKPTEMLDLMFSTLTTKCTIRGDIIRGMIRNAHTTLRHEENWEMCQRDPCLRVREAIEATEP